LVVALFAVSSLSAAGERKTFDPDQFSTGKFHGCPPAGQGSDPYLNTLKNRDRPPATARLFTVNSLYKTSPTLPNRKIHRDKWTTQQQDLAARWESRAVTVEGYLLHDVAKEREDACNCGSDKYGDHHMWPGPTPTAQRGRAMVVEVSPRTWAAHPAWNNAAKLRPLIKDKMKVRVTGWLTWDQEHNEQIRKGTRRTLWEVHPITQIQVLRATNG
jgi:hypothetical protein